MSSSCHDRSPAVSPAPMPDGFGFPRRVWFIGFAGHRKIADRAAAKEAIARELAIVRATLPGEAIGFASAAAGADLLFLQACREAGLKTVLLLPFAKERFRADFDNDDEWQAACHEIETAWWCEVTPGGEEAPAAYHVVAREGLEISDRMLFLWDGKEARGLGGTAETLTEAIARKVPSRVIDSTTLQASWKIPPPSLPIVANDEDLPPARDVRELFEKLDHRAAHFAPRSRWFAAGSMSLNHSATVFQAFLVALLMAAEESGTFLKFLMVSVATMLPWFGGKFRWQERWVRDRVRAELLRSLLCSHEPGSPLHSPALELFGREKEFLRTAAMQLVKERRGWEAARDEYVTARVDGQIAYLTSKGELAAKWLGRFRKAFWIASWGAIISGAYSFTTAYLHSHLHLRWDGPLNFFAVGLPSVAAWCLAMISVFEFKRRAALYSQLVEELQRLRAKVAGAYSASAVTHAMHQVERLLLNELWEWQGSRRK